MSIDFSPILDRALLLWDGAEVTLSLAFFSTVFGFALGTGVAVARRSKNKKSQLVSAAYIEVVRNTPLLVQVFLIYFGLSSAGFSLSAFSVAVIALVLNVGAYTAEIMRAGFNTVSKSQWETAEALGLNRWQAYWHVALRPAMERVYPSLTSQFILLMLASSITSQISLEELTAAANFIQSETYRPFETYIVVAVIYLLLSLIMRLAFEVFALIAFPRYRKLKTPLGGAHV
ncbi:amino acid ABC transporter permease [Brucella pseudogrignonensis]|uniref:amino acid ABC transporter permease n=1 Tax=Brucella pseudogrignonensis TaxID=419475 RepID=UPI0028B867AD|nr:amino acid ABC transporter permease [Brucella pseudogrignonensis]MDT6942568.1 amino acid ABC transporter permease [Brucella pseudogrignonensis]